MADKKAQTAKRDEKNAPTSIWNIILSGYQNKLKVIDIK